MAMNAAGTMRPAGWSGELQDLQVTLDMLLSDSISNYEYVHRKHVHVSHDYLTSTRRAVMICVVHVHPARGDRRHTRALLLLRFDGKVFQHVCHERRYRVHVCCRCISTVSYSRVNTPRTTTRSVLKLRYWRCSLPMRRAGFV